MNTSDRPHAHGPGAAGGGTHEPWIDVGARRPGPDAGGSPGPERHGRHGGPPDHERAQHPAVLRGEQPDALVRYGVAAGQSYCVEAAGASFENLPVDTFLDVFQDDGTTVIGSNDDATGQPELFRGSRFCYTASADGRNTVRVRPSGAAPAVNTHFQVRVVGNMLYGPSWFTSSLVDTSLQLRNTTSTGITVTATARSTDGAAVGTPFTVLLAGNGGATISIRNELGVAFGVGTLDVATDAAPGAVAGKLVTLGSTLRVLAEAPLTMREQAGW
jgi:hypothetical protein